MRWLHHLLRSAALLILLAAAAHGASLDPLLRGLAARDAAQAAGKSTLTLRYESIVALEADPRTGETRVGVILEIDGAMPDLSAVDGLQVGSRIGDIVTARLPVRSLAALESVPEVRHVRASTLSYPTLDVASPDIRVVDVWNGSNTYSGQGVLVGVIDSGVDFTHDDFRNANGTTRLKAIWDVFATGGAPPAGFTSGVEFTESQINAALTGGGTVSQKDLSGHGTHVVGDAAGNGRASSGQFKGPAFAADLLFAKPFDDQTGGFPSDKTIDAMNYLVQKAQALGKPIAINMSLGGHFGSHDGTDPQEKVVDQLSGPGVVFCIAAGNEGGDFLHHKVNANPGSFLYRVIDGTANQGGNNDFALVILWVEGNTSPSVTVTTPTAGTTPAVASGQQNGFNTPDGVVIIENATQGVDPNSGDKAILIQLDDQTGTEVKGGDWTIQVTGGSGTIHAWQVASSMVSGFPNSDQSYSVGVPGTAESAVTVAAYKTRNEWQSQAGTSSYSGDFGAAAVGDRAPFSSIGPTRDERQKPDVSAPGMAIVAPYSKDQDPPGTTDVLVPGGKYYATQGTSMATPITCGVVALMLEKKNDLTASEVRSILRTTARTDTFTGTAWNNRFGAGKVDAQAALTAVPGGGGGGAATGDIDLDGQPTVIDVVRLVNHILDPVGNAFTTAQRERADVFPAGGGDGLLNASDVARIVNFIVKLDVPSAPDPGLAPASVTLGPAVYEGDLVRVPVTVRGAAVTAGQFRVRAEGLTWVAEDTRVQEAGAAVSARAGGDDLRVLFYAPDGRLADDSVTFHLTGRSPGGDAAPRIDSILLADRGGFAREVRVAGDGSGRSALLGASAAPNPLLGATTIRFTLAAEAAVRLEIFDVSGRMVRTLREGTMGPGEHDVPWDGSDAEGRRLPSGVYFYRVGAGDRTITHKLVIEG